MNIKSLIKTYGPDAVMATDKYAPHLKNILVPLDHTDGKVGAAKYRLMDTVKG